MAARYVVAPALDAQARTLHLAVPAIEWISYGPAQPGPTVEASVPVNWMLSVALG